MRSRGRGSRWLIVGIAALMATVGLVAGLVGAGVVHPNSPSDERYPVRGVDVSRYQGDIDWPVLARQGIDFAFVAGKFASPFWQWWDVLMLWLALIHGANGMRTIVNDYVTGATTRKVLVWALWIAAEGWPPLHILAIFIVGTQAPPEKRGIGAPDRKERSARRRSRCDDPAGFSSCYLPERICPT